MTVDKNKIEIKGAGEIQEKVRGRVYTIRLRIPPLTPGGKRRWSPMRTVHGNKDAARREMEKYRKELEAKLNNEISGDLVSDYAREFHERRKAMGTLSPLTYDRDELEIERIEEIFNDVTLDGLDVRRINREYAKLRRGGMSPSELHKLHQKLSQVMKEAVLEGAIPRNPCDSIRDVKRPAPKERRSLSREQAMQLAHDLKESERTGRIVAVWLALATGLRRGEALGLTWNDVNLGTGRIYISKQLDKTGALRDPKSAKSKRNLAIDDGTVIFLKEWKKLQSQEFFGSADVPGTTPVCTNETGGFISPAAFDKWRRVFFVEHGLGTFDKEEIWYDKKGVKRYRRTGYHGFNLHELRHTQATLLIGSGADIKTVQNRLGHSSASLTMNIYAHAIEQNDRDAADSIGGMLGL